MTNAKAARVLETDVILFSPQLKQEVLMTEAKTEIVEVKKTTLKTDVKNRFARLKKSMRRRSAGIL